MARATLAQSHLLSGKWQVVRLIGVGGMGTVYEVRHRVLGTRKAVKVLKSDLALREDLLERFTREARRMAQLNHPHIVKVDDIDEDAGVGTYLVMDLVDGGSLREVLDAEGARRYEQVLQIGSEIASALDAAHHNNIVHRDIKPGNIMIERSTGRAVLTDFGIAKELDPEGDQADATQPGVLVGTPRYCSPEQLRGEQAHPRWDVYALGAVLYEAYSGKRYLGYLKNAEIAGQVAYKSDFRAKLEFPAAPPREFREVIERCIDPDPARRIASAQELGKRLGALRTSARPAATLTGLAPRREPREAPPSDATEATRTEAYGDVRGELRTAITRQLDTLRTLEALAAANQIDVPAEAATTPLASGLAEAARLEQDARYAEALARLDHLHEAVGAAQVVLAAALRRGFGRLGTALADQHEALRRAAPATVDAERERAVSDRLRALREAVGREQWDGAASALEAARREVRIAEQGARRVVEEAAKTLLYAMGMQLVELRDLGEQPPEGIDLDAVRSEVQACLDRGEFGTAHRRAEAAQAAVGAAVEGARGRAGERVRAALARLDQLAADIDLKAAAAVAPREVARARDALARAEQAAQESQHRTTLTACARAEDACRAVAARLAEAAEQDAALRAASLEALLAATAGVPGELAGLARERARLALERFAASPAAGRDDLAAALAALEAVRGEAAALHEAEAARALAAAAGQRCAGLPLAAAEQAAAERLMDEAARCLDERRWTDASARYTAAAERWTALEQRTRAELDAAQRQQDERYAELRGAAERQLAALVELAAAPGAAGAPADLDELRRALDAHGAAVPRAELAAALASLAALLQRIEGAVERQRAALRRALEQALAALDARWQARCAACGELLDRAQRQAFERRRAEIDRDLGAGHWADAHGRVADTERWVDTADRELRRATEAALAVEIEALVRDREMLVQAGGPPVGALDRAQVSAALAAGELAAARRAVDDARSELTRVSERLREEDVRRTATARAAAAALLDGLDPRAAAAAAADCLARGREQQAQGQAAERRGEHRAARAAYEAAAGEYRAAAEAVADAEQRQLAERRAAVERLFERAAPEPQAVVGDACAAARAALALAEGADRRAALAALDGARTGLEAALAAAVAHAEAAACRAAAEEQETLAADLPLEPRERRPAQALLTAAAEAFARGSWSAARQHYEQAAQRLTALVREGQARAETARLAAERHAAAGAELRAAVERSQALPDELAGARLRSAAALLAAPDASVEALHAAAAALAAALADEERYAAAVTQRTAARAAEERAAGTPLPRRAYKRAQREMKTGDRAVASGQWERAGESYAAAASALASLQAQAAEAEVTLPGGQVGDRSRLPARAAAISAAALVAVGLAVWWWTRLPTPPVDEPVQQQQAAAERVVIEPAAVPPRPAAAPVQPGSGLEGRLPGTAPGTAGGPPAVADGSAKPAGEPPALPVSPDRVKAGAVGPAVAPPQPAGVPPQSTEPEQAAKAGPVHGAGEPVVDEHGAAPPAQAEVPSGPVPAEPAQHIQQAALPPARILSASPSTAGVTVRENQAQKFAIELGEVHGQPSADVNWTWNGQRLPDAHGKTSWQYKPSFDAASGPYELTVRVGDGTGPEQTQSWTVSVVDVNRAPRIVSAEPARGKPLRREVGERVTFQVKAADDDSDPLHFAWTVDGQPAGDDRPSLTVDVPADRLVAVAISDGRGDDPQRLDWRIAAVQAPLLLAPEPRALEPLRFKQPQPFALRPPAGEEARGLRYAWALDGQTVSDAARYVFPNDDPRLVRSKPVRVTASARDERGREFTHEWQLRVLPPPPAVARTSPPRERPVDAQPGAPQRFEVVAAPPVGEQALTYQFEAGGRTTESASPVFELPPAGEPPRTVAAVIKDNFGQRSPRIEWSIVAPAPVVDLAHGVERWLHDYRQAYEQKDIARLGALLRLSAERSSDLTKALEAQHNPRVSTSDLRTESLGSGRARVSYTLMVDFDDPTGRERSVSRPVSQTFRAAGAGVELESAE